MNICVRYSVFFTGWCFIMHDDKCHMDTLRQGVREQRGEGGI